MSDGMREHYLKMILDTTPHSPIAFQYRDGLVSYNGFTDYMYIVYEQFA